MAFAAAKAIPPGGTIKCGCSSSGRAPPCQGGGSEFEPRQPLQKTKHRLSVDAFCFIRRIFLPRASMFSSIRQHRFAISPVPASLMQKARICPIESVFGRLRRPGGVGAHRQGDCRRLAAEKKGDRTPYGFLSPLDSPYLPLRRHIGDVQRNGGYGGSVPCVGSLLGRCYALNFPCVVRRA